jgi:signal transduction histidine kinase/ActR/RegA family two-component response regulator
MLETVYKYFELCYDLLPFPVEVFNRKGFVFYVNNAFSKKWGYSLSELNGYSYSTDTELAKRNITQKIDDVFKNKKTLLLKNYIDSRLLGGEKAAPFLWTTIFPLELEKEEYVVLFHEDQTDIILAEEEVRKARDASKEAERLKGTFLNVLSHELRTPLNIILGYSTIIKENLKDKISSEDKIYLDNLYSGSERLFKSITQMLEFAQIEAGRYQLNVDSFDLVNIFKNCIDPFRKRASEKRLDFTTRFEEENIFVDVDLQCVEGVINNLLDNSIKFTRQGYIDVEVTTFRERELAVCKIKDTGIGISSEYLDHLYRPFSQEDLDIGRTFEGNGLGLAISKRYIEKMGGSLIVDSIKGVGSTFTFTLPLAKIGRLDKLKKTAVKSNGQSKILMLDDSGDSYELIRAFLKDSCDINLLASKEFNLSLLSDTKFSAIIFDVTINYWDKGLEIVREIKKTNDKNIPILVLSSEFLQEKIQQFIKAGADEFLVKPFAKGELVSLINKITAH